MCVRYANVEQHFTPAFDRICAAIHLHARQILLIKKLSQCHNQSNCLPTEVINAITHEFILLAAALITLCLCVDLLTSCQLPVASLEWLQFAADQVWHASCESRLASTRNEAGGETKLLLIELQVEASERRLKYAATLPRSLLQLSQLSSGLELFSLYMLELSSF